MVISIRFTKLLLKCSRCDVININCWDDFERFYMGIILNHAFVMRYRRIIYPIPLH